MSPQTWADVINSMLLAAGAALFLGTGAALLHYRRHGVFPNQPTDSEGRPLQPPAVKTALFKVVLGLVLGIWGIAGLTAGLVIA